MKRWTRCGNILIGWDSKDASNMNPNHILTSWWRK
jgi:hypothetical protein